jgi:TRAP transporter 4TM/12TM fusion protein
MQEDQTPEVRTEIDLDELRRKFDTEARYRSLSGWQALLVTVVSIGLSLFHLWTAGMGLMPQTIQLSIHLGLILFMVFLLYPGHKKASRDRIPWYDFLLALAAAYAVMYHVIYYNELVLRPGLPTTMDIIVGFTGIALLLEGTRRVSNPVLPVIAIFFILYCYYGRYFPSIFAHRGYNTMRIINHMYLGTEGVFGTPLYVSATFVFMFILFGTFLEQTGMGRFIIDLAMALAGHSTGGPAKVAVLSSGLMGSISGSSVANVCTTGMFTIPLMKSVGYRPAFAGAVEAVASTGGQIMPPVMGAAAFIMATMMEVPYLEVAAAAVIPALLYYFAVMVQVHFEATRLGLKGLPREHLPLIVPLLKSKGHLLIPLFGIIYFLIAGYTPLKAAFNGILLTIAVSYVKRETRLTLSKLKDALEGGARGAMGVACACGTVGIVVGTATLTGLGLSIANAIVQLAGGYMLPTLMLTMVACILLGAGLPTTANFIVTSTMAAPALFKLGVPPMATYMFVLYFGIAADLSPPVALAAYAGAGIAGADPMRTGMNAVKLALAGFLVPYIYVFNPILVLVGVESRTALLAVLVVVIFGIAFLALRNREKAPRVRIAWGAAAALSLAVLAYLIHGGRIPLQFVLAIFTALIGVFLLGMSTVGHYKVVMPSWMRALALGGALGLLVPGIVSDFVGILILATIHLLQTARARKGETEH